MSILLALKRLKRRIEKNICTPFQKKLYSAFIFLAKFALLSLPLHLLLWVNFDATAVQEFVAWAVGSMLSASGVAVNQAGTFIAVSTITVSLQYGWPGWGWSR